MEYKIMETLINKEGKKMRGDTIDTVSVQDAGYVDKYISAIVENTVNANPALTRICENAYVDPFGIKHIVEGKLVEKKDTDFVVYYIVIGNETLGTLKEIPSDEELLIFMFRNFYKKGVSFNVYFPEKEQISDPAVVKALKFNGVVIKVMHEPKIEFHDSLFDMSVPPTMKKEE